MRLILKSFFTIAAFLYAGFAHAIPTITSTTCRGVNGLTKCNRQLRVIIIDCGAADRGCSACQTCTEKCAKYKKYF